jgi:hypothetical protein
MGKPQKSCKQCGCLAIGIKGVASFFIDDVCVVCRESEDFGLPDWCRDLLRVYATAFRAANKVEWVMCQAPKCKNRAREWWFTCSRRCRDALVRSLL